MDLIISQWDPGIIWYDYGIGVDVKVRVLSVPCIYAS